MSTGFETRQLTVDKLFSEQFKFSFPPFQRPYRWSVDEAETLLEDLVEAAAMLDSGEPYFLGSIVVSGSDDKQLSVIDGRQRLTTLFILFAVLRDLETDPAFRQELHGLLRDEANLVKRVDPGWRFKLGPSDTAFFEEWIGQLGATEQSPGEAESPPERHVRLTDVAKVFRDRLAAPSVGATPGGGLPVRRHELVEFVLHRCELIVVKAADEQQALRLFQVLNSRGMELSQTDLARPQLMNGLTLNEQVAAAEVWDRVDERLGSARVDTLLRAMVFLFDGQWVSPDQPFAEPLVAAVRGFGVSRFHVEGLAQYAEAMDRLTREELPYTDRKRNPNPLIRGLTWLGRSEREWKEWLPVALECVVTAGEDDDRLYELIRALDRLFWVLFLNDVDEHQRRTLCAQLLTEIRGGGGASEGGPLRPAAALLVGARAGLVRPFDKAHKRAAVARRVELQLEAEFGQDLHPNIDRAAADFVLPSAYPSANRAWTDLFDRAAHRECAGLLGNAVLLNRGLDREAAGASYAEKKKLYTKYKWPRPFETVKDLVTRYPVWTPSAAKERTERLANLLSGTWEL
jgi:Protein of unknown function DUF262/Protein of unknown function (DUF1524)